jgi:hypothetical protein
MPLSFKCLEARRRERLLKDDSDRSGFAPMLAIKSDDPEPLIATDRDFRCRE